MNSRRRMVSYKGERAEATRKVSYSWRKEKKFQAETGLAVRKDV
jgi:hypothetical protein